jgi:hypothetical protein
MKINLHIERLVLDGLPASGRDGPAIERALRQELSWLLANTHFTQGQAIASLRGTDLTLSKADPKSIGRKIATSLHGGLTK